jgi:hypothetical protein
VCVFEILNLIKQPHFESSFYDVFMIAEKNHTHLAVLIVYFNTKYVSLPIEINMYSSNNLTVSSTHRLI